MQASGHLTSTVSAMVKTEETAALSGGRTSEASLIQVRTVRAPLVALERVSSVVSSWGMVVEENCEDLACGEDELLLRPGQGPLHCIQNATFNQSSEKVDPGRELNVLSHRAKLLEKEDDVRFSLVDR